jgi:sporulation protein YlmC with PRC-barrel domain
MPQILNYLRFAQKSPVGIFVNASEASLVKLISWKRYTNTMLQLSASLLNKSVLSLRTGTPIATITGAIINPNNLKIEGFYCQDRYDKKELILLYQDIRDIMPKGYVVNDHDVLVEAEELVRLKDVLELNFELIGKHVETISKQKVGKVSDYAAEVETMFVQKIYVAQSILKSFTGGSLSIDRTQINEITPKRIIINDLLKGAPATAPAAIS